MSTQSLSLEALATRRAAEIKRSHFCTILLSVTDPESRGGIVLGQSTYGKKEITAYFFKPASLKRAFAYTRIHSAHDHLQALSSLRARLDADKALKVAPHTLEVGDIISATWGATMRGVRFYQVVGIPHPRKVALVQLASQMVSGDWMAGEEMPILPEGVLPDTKAEHYTVSMKSGSPMIDMKSYITYARKWDGKPVHIYSD